MQYSLSENGLAMIKKFEGLRLKAYKAVSTEKHYTIGYGHYAADITKDMVITETQATAYLKSDVAASEKAVNSYKLSWMNQNRFDALVSFCYNCGSGNLKTLLGNGGRSASTVSMKITEYNKSGGMVLQGLVSRRKAEKTLFDTACTSALNNGPLPEIAAPTLKILAYGDEVKKLQQDLNYLGFAGKNQKALECDSDFGENTQYSLKCFQKHYDLKVDGIYGSKSQAKMKEVII